MVKKAKQAAGFLGRVAKAAVTKFFTAWSYSRYKDHRQCPRYAYWNHILKKPQGPKHPAMQRGGDIHKEGESYLLGRLKTVPAPFAAFALELKELRRLKATPEGKWATTAKWLETDFFDWAGAWLRVVLDASVLVGKRSARVIDFKTGRIYPDDNKEQVELYAAVTFAKYAAVDEVDVELWYLDQPRGDGGELPNPYVRTFKRAEAAKLRKKWERLSLPILTDRRFPPKPGPNCARCPYSLRKKGDRKNYPAGGDCEY